MAKSNYHYDSNIFRCTLYTVHCTVYSAHLPKTFAHKYTATPDYVTVHYTPYTKLHAANIKIWCPDDTRKCTA